MVSFGTQVMHLYNVDSLPHDYAFAWWGVVVTHINYSVLSYQTVCAPLNSINHDEDFK
jgi:hypothetical protein